LHRYIRGILENRGAQLLGIGGMPDHIHLLLGLQPTQARWLNRKLLPATRFEWQAGYAAFTVSESRVSAVKRYIAQHKEHHSSRSFEAEWEWLLKNHNVEMASP
jgi:REP element-mobilizing transposase RayT